MRKSWAIAALGDRVACIEMWRTPRGGLCSVTRADSRGAPAGAAWLLPPHATMVIEGTPAEIDRARVRLERVGERPLASSPIQERGERRRTMFASLAALASLPKDGRGVALSSALAALASYAGARGACGVYWAVDEARFLYAVERGFPLAAPAHGLPVLVLTEPDACGRELIAAAQPRGTVASSLEGTEGVPPLVLVAMGVALAARRRGSFPALPRRGRHLRSEPARWGMCLALLATTATWNGCMERTRGVLAERRAERQTQLEQTRWESAPGPRPPGEERR